MRKTILLIMLAALSANTHAVIGDGKHWTAVADDEGTITYVFPSSIRKAGDISRMWSLINHKTLQTRSSIKTPFLSEKSEEEYDCRGRRLRTLSFSFHTEKMGVGEVVHSNSNPAGWQNVAPDTDPEILWKIACGETKIR